MCLGMLRQKETGPNPQVIFHYSQNTILNKILYYESFFSFFSIHAHTHKLVAVTDVVAFKTSKSSADPRMETLEAAP